MNAPLSLTGITKQFALRPGLLVAMAGWLSGTAPRSSFKAVEDVDLDLRAGEILGVVGESGCGKTTLGRIAAGLSRPSAGAVRYGDTPVSAMTQGEHAAYTLAVQMIFQNPFSALNPRHRVRRIVGEAPVRHGLVSTRDMDRYVAEMLTQVGLDPAYAARYPHQFSGGQRQRICIARALAVRPRVLVCDEVVSALDVSIQAQILNLLLDLRAAHGLSAMFISHDLGVVRYLADRVAVMYLGRIVELAPAEAFFADALHPYSAALLAELPTLAARKRRYQAIRGEIPSPLAPPPGCAFHPRCPQAMDRCRVERPLLRPAPGGRQVACHLHSS